MEASFSADRLKAFHHALTCLSKLGEVLNFHISRGLVPIETEGSTHGAGNAETVLQTSLRVSAINSSSSAFCAFVFAESFFDHIRLKPSSRSSEAPKKLECQVNTRSLLASLKTSSSRKLDKCEFSITDGQECYFAVRLHHQFGVTKTHRLTYEAQEALYPSANPDNASIIVVGAEAVQEWLLHFAITGRGADISFWCEADSCSVRSKSDEFDVGKNRRSIQTEVKVDPTQFDVYQVSGEVFLSLPLKEFRAAVAFAEAIGSHLELHFSAGGEPLFIKILGDSLSAEVVIATTDSKPAPRDGQLSGATAASHTSPSTQRRDDTHLNVGKVPQPTIPGPGADISPATNGLEETTGQTPKIERMAKQGPPPTFQAAVPSQEPSTVVGPPLRPSQFPQESTPPSESRSHNRRTIPQPPPPMQAQTQDEDFSTSLFRGGPSASQEQPPLSRASAPASARIVAPPSASSRRRLTSEPHLSLAQDGDEGDDTFDCGDGIDYGGALDEMERDIEAGHLVVHGSQAFKSSQAAAPEKSEAKRISLEQRDDSPGDETAGDEASAVEPAAAEAGEESTTMDESIAQYEAGSDDRGQAGESIQQEAVEEEELPPTQAPRAAAGDAGLTDGDRIRSAAEEEESLPRKKKFRPMNF
ncbi:hypothetical protein BCV69DRAFT_280742 [Microstroma glucosiphilum]|uniref:Rad9-domain-containing protein n=1 Tax=Pseudomicrostroma glucosiphilum TaxID=1684307 RepID=A0A316UD50_9BASI|nr:hypothetical protein BCV69DRAFT_280742 [Pseudomicrostroma glucosiphilum]PWN23126.1 hypothetical protein BCV69DRAFT_280742 [Pseudomicrostroma glucosiphilum]